MREISLEETMEGLGEHSLDCFDVSLVDGSLEERLLGNVALDFELDSPLEFH